MSADVDKVFKALAAPERRLLLDRLRADNGQTLGQLCGHLDMSHQAVMKHLKLLEEATLVVTIWRGREKLHYLNPMPIQDIAERWIGKHDQGRVGRIAAHPVEPEEPTRNRRIAAGHAKVAGRDVSILAVNS